MDLIKNFVIILVTLLIFISAIEIIAPDNSMKKYVKFVLGLILTAVILSPILSIVLDGETKLKDSIDKFQKQYSQNEKKNQHNEQNVLKIQEKNFKENLSKNCESMLKKQFKDLDFSCDIDCDIDIKDEKFLIKLVNVTIKDKNIKKIKKVEKVEINKENKKEEKKENKNSEFKEVVDFISKEFQIDENKINIYKVE
ncbi:stage III sporulation protein AF [Clostridium sp.]|uniref:stage III sporulation protein AF n=1 Tax=Clostridium sp. TaxID=1506 RepID=UPI0026DD7B0F|nr:stage III sporulation protein AF [Clostridium sp.]MDO5039887.1 stage III sporulation protein AF [Clostridium sp.]